jgi:WD40 repeat protein
VSAVSFVPKDNNLVLAAQQARLQCLDVRRGDVPVRVWDAASDDISSISVHEDGNAIVLGIDSGEICIAGTSESTLRPMAGRHQNMCSAARFRPKTKGRVLSSGLDSMLLSLDTSAPSKAPRTLNLAEIPPPSNPLALASSSFINPPFGFSLDVSADGARAAVGLGSGAVALVDCLAEGRLKASVTLCNHTGSVGAVHFARFDPIDSLFSGGNDARVCLWRGCKSGRPTLSESFELGEKINALGSMCARRKSVIVASVSSGLQELVLRS